MVRPWGEKCVCCVTVRVKRWAERFFSHDIHRSVATLCFYEWLGFPEGVGIHMFGTPETLVATCDGRTDLHFFIARVNFSLPFGEESYHRLRCLLVLEVCHLRPLGRSPVAQDRDR